MDIYKTIIQFRSDFRDEMQGLNDNLRSTYDAQEENAVKVVNMAKKLDLVSKRLEKIAEETSLIKNLVVKLEALTVKLDQDAKKKSLEIRGIPYRICEDPVVILNNVCKGLGLKISNEDIDNVYRAKPGRTSTAPPSIIATFTRQIVRDSIMESFRMKQYLSTRDVGWTDDASTPIYINEGIPL